MSLNVITLPKSLYRYVPKLYQSIAPPIGITAIRLASGVKPWNIGPEGAWKKGRSKKVIKVQLPDFNDIRMEKKMSPEEIRSKMKEKGIAPPREYSEKPLTISCTSGIFEPYVPPEGDGKRSIISAEGAKQRAVRVEKKTKSLWNIRRIRTFEDEWDPHTFANHAMEIYIKAHESLAAKDEDALHQFVTEYLYPEMTFQTEKNTIKWKFINAIEPPKVVHVRTTEIITKDNEFAQITVRFNTRQILAIYDRFGRLMYGSDAVVKDVLEYVVFEKQIAHEYGVWRMHAKVIPDWMPPREPILRTYQKPPSPPPLTEDEIKDKEERVKKQEEEYVPKDDPKADHTKPQPALA